MSSVITLFQLFTIGMILLFCLFYFTDKRRILNGVLLTVCLYCLLGNLVLLVFWSGSFPLLIVGMALLVFALFLFPVLSLVIGFFLIRKSPQLLRKEGARPHNFLSLFFGLFFLGGWFVIPAGLFSSPPLPSWVIFLLMILGTGYLYLLFTFVCTLVSSWLLAVNQPRLNQDFLIILGCKVSGEELTPLLRQRTDRAIEFYRRQELRDQRRKKKKQLMLIPSGGQGPDEPIAEAEAMRRYLIAQGIPEDRILAETKSANTFENMAFSKALMDSRKKRYKCVFCTSDYHVFRAGLLSKKAGIRHASGIGSRTVSYFSYNAFIREYIASLSMHRKFHLIMIVLLCLPALIGLYFLG